MNPLPLPATTSCLRGNHVECSGTCMSSGRTGMRVVGDPPDVYTKRPCGCPCHRGYLAPVALLLELATLLEGYACEELDLARATDASARARGLREAAQLLGRPLEDS